MNLERAYSTFEVKSVNDDAGIITGIASTPEADRVGDIVEPRGAKFKLPLPFLWHHDKGDPLGHVTHATVTDRGIEVIVQVQRGVTAAIDDKWKVIKAGLVRGLSIGFRGIEAEAVKGAMRGIRFKSWDWLELSAVTIPANSSASIQSVKAFDIGAPIGAEVVRIAPLARSSAAYSIPLHFPKE